MLTDTLEELIKILPDGSKIEFNSEKELLTIEVEGSKYTYKLKNKKDDFLKEITKKMLDKKLKK